jgi:hypothetical protein
MIETFGKLGGKILTIFLEILGSAYAVIEI